MSKIKFLYNLSIKNKIVAIILLVTYLCLGIGFMFFAFWDINRLKSEIQSNLELNAKVIGDNCIVPLTFNDKPQATTALSHLHYVEFIETACLYDKNEKLFAVYPDTLNLNTCLPLIEQPNSVFKNKYFYIKVAVLFQDEIYGTLVVKANSQPITDVKKNLIFTLFLISLLLVVLSSILANRMQKYISQPIIKLKKHFYEIAKNQDFSVQLTKPSNDEIGSLYDGFNNLTKQIQTRSNERDAAEENYQDSQNKLDLALRGGGIGIWEWDLVSNATIWDTRMEKMFGIEEGTFGNSYEAYQECLHPDDIAMVENEIKNALDEIKPYDTIFRVIWKNKETKYIKAKALISKDEKGKNIRMIGVCFDITELKKAEEELKKHKNELEDIVNERTKELEIKYLELEKMNKIFVGRELRMVELKNKIKDLESNE